MKYEFLNMTQKWRVELNKPILKAFPEKETQDKRQL